MAQHPALPYLRSSEKGKVVTAAEAVRLIRDGDTVATGGFVGIGFAEEIALALEELYLSVEAEPPYCTGKPRKTAQAMVFQLAISLMPVVRRRMGGPRAAWVTSVVWGFRRRRLLLP